MRSSKKFYVLITSRTKTYKNNFNNFTILYTETFKRQTVMQKPDINLFSYSSFKKTLQIQNDPILIQDSEQKAHTPRGFKSYRYRTQNFTNVNRISRTLKDTSFVIKRPNNFLQPEETSMSFIYKKKRTVDKIYNSKEKNQTKFTSRNSYDKISTFARWQNSQTKNWVAEVKCTTFNNYLQLKKQQTQKNKSSFSFAQNLKLQKYKPQTERHHFESLRQTEDTIPDGSNFTKNNWPKISDFQLVKLLGKGKNGEVYLMIHKSTGFACALKIIKKKSLHKSSAEQRKKAQDQLLNQIKIQLYLRHPNLIELYGVFTDRQNIYLIQQLGVNGQLYELMKKQNKFSQDTTALMASSIIEGIQAMHWRKVIHRDLKPENIVLIYGVCKICDFGWSIYSKINDMRSTLCGTLLYISPEMLIGNNYNEKIDIWAYGILVYELFTGQNPFRIKDKSDLNRVLTDELVLGENMPDKLKDFIHCILKKQIELRPTAEQVKKHKWLQKYKDLQTSEQLAKM